MRTARLQRKTEDFFGGSGYGLYNNGVAVDPTAGTIVSSKPIPPLGGLMDVQSMDSWQNALKSYNSLVFRSQTLGYSDKFQFDTAIPSYNSGQGRRIDVFTQYTKVMKVFLGGKITLRE
jgi:hypothetical protein